MNTHTSSRLYQQATRLSAAIAIAASATSQLAHAEVKSLSSSELTETYIEDSTIIITPKRNNSLSKQKTISSVTIAPYQGEDTDSELIMESEESQTGLSNAVALSDELLRNSTVDQVFIPDIEVEIPTYQELVTRPVADILEDERYRAPEGNFDFDYIGDDLGLSREGDQLTFSIGNIPGINPINIPEAVNEGPVQIQPRPGGGFDLTFTVPEQQ